MITKLKCCSMSSHSLETTHKEIILCIHVCTAFNLYHCVHREGRRGREGGREREREREREIVISLRISFFSLQLISRFSPHFTMTTSLRSPYRLLNRTTSTSVMHPFLVMPTWNGELKLVLSPFHSSTPTRSPADLTSPPQSLTISAAATHPLTMEYFSSDLRIHT